MQICPDDLVDRRIGRRRSSNSPAAAADASSRFARFVFIQIRKRHRLRHRPAAARTRESRSTRAAAAAAFRSSAGPVPVPASPGNPTAPCAAASPTRPPSVLLLAGVHQRRAEMSGGDDRRARQSSSRSVGQRSTAADIARRSVDRCPRLPRERSADFGHVASSRCTSTAYLYLSACARGPQTAGPLQRLSMRNWMPVLSVATPISPPRASISRTICPLASPPIAGLQDICPIWPGPASPAPRSPPGPRPPMRPRRRRGRRRSPRYRTSEPLERKR